MTRHLLEVDDVTPEELAEILRIARESPGRPLEGLGVALVMGLPSARTRNATEMAVHDLGGHAVAMGGAELGIDSRESAEDVACTLAQYHRVICARIADHGVLGRMAAAIDAGGFEVPVVNLLSGEAHPVQALADLLTLADVAGGPAALASQRIAWVGDANNVARSVTLAAVGVGMHVSLAAPEGHRLEADDAERIARYAEAAGLGGRLEEVGSPLQAVDGALAICTDVWVSMGQEAEHDQRVAGFRGYQIDESLLAAAGADAVLLHCLPAHRGEEVTDGALDGPRSRIWLQAAHRRTAMRGLLTWLTAGAR